MRTLEPFTLGSHLWDVLKRAVEIAGEGEDVQFAFNNSIHSVRAHESWDIAKARVEQTNGWPLLSPEEISEKARVDIARRKTEQDAAIAAVGASTEAEMRDAKVPWLRTLDELTTYIKSLTERPHDYGTCVYAMSMAATAAFYHVSSALGCTGFQAGCADMDVLRRTRGLKYGFRLINYEDALYPQYWDDERCDIYRALMKDHKTREALAKAAREKLSEDRSAHPDVIAHWRRIVEWPA